MGLVLTLTFASLGSVGAVLGAGAVLLAHTRSQAFIPWLVSYATGTLLGAAFTAGFIYIALADLVPGLHRLASLPSLAGQLMLILAGVGTIALIRAVG